jgi:pimeloyl-ACP methyl ester carboxylesterase
MDIDGNHLMTYRGEGRGRDVLLIHGNSTSSRSFQRQLEGSFGSTHRVFAFDLPGHGLSFPAETPEKDYTLAGYAAILVEISKSLELKHPVYVGWSLGGHILLEAASRLSHAGGLVIFGTPPIGKVPQPENPFLPHPAMGYFFTDHVERPQAIDMASSFFQTGTVFPDFFVEDILRTDGRARAILHESLSRRDGTDEIKTVAGLSVPLAVFHGVADKLINDRYINQLRMPTLWRSNIQFIERAGHAAHWENSDRFNELLGAFIKETV